MSTNNITRHASKRIRKRLGHKRAEEQFGQALLYGTRADEYKGDFKRYLDSNRMKYRSDCIIYKGMIYWYIHSRLITVYGVPQKFKKYLV